MNQQTELLSLNLFEEKPSKGNIARLKIINGAIESIVLNGIESTTYESIAKQIGVRRSHVNYYFKSVDEIISQSFNYFLSTYSGFISEALSKNQYPQELLADYIRANFEFMKKDSTAKTMITLLYYYCSRNPKFMKIQKTLRNSGQIRIKEILIKVGVSQESEEKLQNYTDLVQSLVVGNTIYISTLEKNITKNHVELWTKKTLDACLLALS